VTIEHLSRRRDDTKTSIRRAPPTVADTIDSIARRVRDFAKNNACIDVGHARAGALIGNL